MLVVSQARTASGNPASVELLAYDSKTLEPCADGLLLPGSDAPARIATAEGGIIAAIVTTETRSHGRLGGMPKSHLTFVRLDQWRRVWTTEPLYSSEWNPVEIRFAPAADPDGLNAVVLAESNDGAWTGVITFALRLSSNRLEALDLAINRIAGAPNAIDIDWQLGRAYILSQTYWDETLLARVDCWRGTAGTGTQDLPPASLGTRESVGRGGISALPGGAAIAVLTSHRDPEISRRTRSRIRLFEAQTFQAIGGDVEIAGGTSSSTAALVRVERDLWTATYSDSGAFSYATGVRTMGATLEKFAEHASTQAWRAPLIVANRNRGGVAVAADDSLRVLNAEGAEQARLAGQAQIGAVEWSGDGVFVGAGPQVLRVNPTSGAIEQTSAAGRGHIVQLALVSQALDPSSVSTIASLPAHIHFDGGAPGGAERIIRLTPDTGRRVVAELDPRTRQWLRVGEAMLDDGAGISLSLRDRLLPPTPEGRVAGSVILRMMETDGSVTEDGESRIEVTASSAGTRAPVVQWQSSGLMQSFDHAGAWSLPRILGAPPFHFSHRTRSGPLVEAPDASIVVIDLDAAAEGAMTRQVLLDYVARGGGLLFVGRHTPEQSSGGLRRWLEPLDVLIDADRLVEGRFAVDAQDSSLLGLDQIAIASGCYLEVSGPMDVLVPGLTPRNAALAMRRYGYGRIALLASPTPLEETSLARSEGRRFARGLFGWLAGAHFDVSDSDFDGLPDRLEDSNGNGRQDRGETSMMDPDSDADGIPDGAEDSNFNGRPDEGETDPRLADTDADGLFDGADADPLPVVGTPILASVEPDRGPAEGGTIVEISGRNLPPSPEVWFGDSRSPYVIRVDSTRILAATPEQPLEEMTESLPIRIADRPSAPPTELASGFTFHDRSRARLALESVARTRRAYDGYRGQFALVLEVPEVRIDEVRFSLWFDPGLEQLELNLERSPELVALGRTISLRRLGLYEYRISLGPGDLLTGRVELGTLTFRLKVMPAPAERLHAFFRVPHVRAQWGGVLTDATEETWIDLAGAVEDVARSDDSNRAPG